MIPKDKIYEFVKSVSMMCESKHIWNTQKKNKYYQTDSVHTKMEKKHDLYYTRHKTCVFGEGCDLSGFYQYSSGSGNTRPKQIVYIQK